MSRISASRTIPGQEPDAPSQVQPSIGAEGAGVLRFERVSKTYPHTAMRPLLRRSMLSWLTRSKPEHFYALRNVSFDLRPGMSLAIVGANGAGKSTLLRCATGITSPDVGQIEIRGTVAALMELGAGFHPDLTGAENVVLNASLLGLTRRQAYEQFDGIVEFAGIGNYINEPLRTYSSGMVLRLAFSVAVRVDPDVLVIDEILTVGDIDFQHKCIAEIGRLKKSGKTLICVAHDLRLLRELCEQALWLEHGELRMFGPSDQVLSAYENAPPPSNL